MWDNVISGFNSVQIITAYYKKYIFISVIHFVLIEFYILILMFFWLSYYIKRDAFLPNDRVLPPYDNLIRIRACLMNVIA
jgi:hypothetical protein